MVKILSPSVQIQIDIHKYQVLLFVSGDLETDIFYEKIDIKFLTPHKFIYRPTIRENEIISFLSQF